MTDAPSAIRRFFAIAWADRTAVAWENETFAPAGGEAWVRLALGPATWRRETKGAAGERIFGRSGTVLCQVFVREGDGASPIESLSHEARRIFEGARTMEGIRFGDIQARDRGHDGYGWYQETFAISYEFDETL